MKIQEAIEICNCMLEEIDETRGIEKFRINLKKEAIETLIEAVEKNKIQNDKFVKAERCRVCLNPILIYEGEENICSFCRGGEDE